MLLGPPVLPAAEAADRLDAVRRGWLDDSLGAVAGQPWLVVDVTGAESGLDLSAPAGLGVVVVAVDRAPVPGTGHGADVCLAAVDAPAPWVCPPAGIDAGLERLDQAIGRSPVAAATLVQLLRLGRALSVADAVVAESLAYSTLQAGPEHARWLAARRARAGARSGAGSGGGGSGGGGPAPGRDGPGEPPVIVARAGPQLSVTLNRPARRNAYSAEMRDALFEALAVALAEPDVRQVRLAGNGPCFSSGGDLDEFGTLDDPASAHVIRTTRNAGIRLSQLAGRTTAVVHGPCFGAGVELPAFVGNVLARPGTTFTLPETAMGLLPGAGGTVSIPRRIGAPRTAWLALSGVGLDVTTALAWGLVDGLEPGPGSGSG